MTSIEAHEVYHLTEFNKTKTKTLMQASQSKCLLLFFRTSSYRKHDTEFRYQMAKGALASGAGPKGKKYGISESKIRWFIKLMKKQEAAYPQVTMVSVP